MSWPRMGSLPSPLNFCSPKNMYHILKGEQNDKTLGLVGLHILIGYQSSE
ncbi:hypothetical protein ACE6H2_015115 [Prunus campanulata]